MGFLYQMRNRCFLVCIFAGVFYFSNEMVHNMHFYCSSLGVHNNLKGAATESGILFVRERGWQ